MDGREREPVTGDAFGAALLDANAGGTGIHVLERDDGLVDVAGTDMYFAEPAEWSHRDKAALDLVAGRVLDVGAGAGRFSLALRQRGHTPLALDYSVGAIEVCRRRGVEHTFHGSLADLVASSTERFDAAALMGHNLAILGSAERAGAVFDDLSRLVRPGGVVVGTCLDPATDDADNVAYHQHNLVQGRLPGRLRLRVRFRRLAGAWFEWLFVPPDVLGDLAAQSGWRLEEATEPDPTYLAVLRAP